METQGELTSFDVVVLGIVFDPVEKKILIGRRTPEKRIKNLTWAFPGGRVKRGEDADKALKRNMEEKTGLSIENIGAFFTRVPQERDDLMLIFFLTRAFGGDLKAGKDIEELKWISPKEIEDHFTTSIHPKLKEFLIDLI